MDSRGSEVGVGRLEQAETVSGWGSQGPKLGVQADGGGKADAESRGTDPERLGERGSQDWGSPREPVRVEARDSPGWSTRPAALSPLESIPEPH